jgi:DNA-binding GntR family transcriptional regulator
MANSSREGESGQRHVLSALRKAILEGDMAPGHRLVGSELAESFGVTRASVRVAILELTKEGLVERIRNRGARVRTASVEEAVATTECRMVLEGLCAAKAAERGSEEQFAQLAEVAQRLRHAVADGEPLKYSALNSELHRLVLEMSGQRVAADLLHRLHGQLVRHQFRLSLRPGPPQTSLPEHLAIVEAIASRDPDAAARRPLWSVIQALRDEEDVPRARHRRMPMRLRDLHAGGKEIARCAPTLL